MLSTSTVSPSPRDFSWLFSAWDERSHKAARKKKRKASRLSYLKRRKIKKNLWGQGIKLFARYKTFAAKNGEFERFGEFSIDCYVTTHYKESRVESTLQPLQADFNPEIGINQLPNWPQDKLKWWCFFLLIEDPSAKLPENAAFEATSSSCAKQSGCLLHADWMYSLASSNQSGVTAWLRLSFQKVTNGMQVVHRLNKHFEFCTCWTLLFLSQLENLTVSFFMCCACVGKT